MIPTTMLETSESAVLASDAQIERTKQALDANNIQILVAENGAEAKKKLKKTVGNYSCQFRSIYHQFNYPERFRAHRRNRQIGAL